MLTNQAHRSFCHAVANIEVEKTMPAQVTYTHLPYKDAIFESRIAFRKYVIYKTFHEIGMHELLEIPRSSHEVATLLSLNEDATTRFLYALASLKIITFNPDSEKFHLSSNPPIFSDKSTYTLIKLLKLKIPDIICPEPQTLEELVLHFPSETNLLQLLEEAVSLKFLMKTDGRYHVPEESMHLLVSSSPDSIDPMLEYVDKIAIPTFTVLLLTAALNSGQSQWKRYLEETSDVEVSHPFQLYLKYPELLEKFTFGLHKMNAEDNKQLVRQLTPVLCDARTVLDVGGGSGCLALAISRQFPDIDRVDIYELPEAIPLMQQIFNRCSPGNSPIKYVAGSFQEIVDFSGLSGLKETDIYDVVTLSWILHDWGDEVNIDMLRKSYLHLKPGGKIIIIEAVLPDNRLGIATISDITMLLHTEGRERTFGEYKNLLWLAGFRNIQLLSTATSRQAIVGEKS